MPSVHVSEETFNRLKQIAETFVDRDPEDVIKRLLSHEETCNGIRRSVPAQPTGDTISHATGDTTSKAHQEKLRGPYLHVKSGGRFNTQHAAAIAEYGHKCVGPGQHNPNHLKYGCSEDSTWWSRVKEALTSGDLVRVG